MFQYFTVQIPPNVSVQSGTPAAAANFLGEVLNTYAAQGWEFDSIETIGVTEHQGCGCLTFLLSLLGVKQSVSFDVYVIVFRRPVHGPRQ